MPIAELTWDEYYAWAKEYRQDVAKRMDDYKRKFESKWGLGRVPAGLIDPKLDEGLQGFSIGGKVNHANR